MSFGGPEGPDDVVPFLRNVTKGRNIPDERLAVVGEHYSHFGGVSPINAQNRELIAAIDAALQARGTPLPIYFGNRNWDPYLADAFAQMRDDGITSALAFVTSAFSSHSGCRQYQDDMERARQQVGEGAPPAVKIRPYFNHPGFVSTMARNVEEALASLGEQRPGARVAYTAHSIPLSMAERCDYEEQLREVARLIDAELSAPHDSELVFQSRSGPPQVRWLEPDICDHIDTLAGESADAVVVAPIGFISDHMEVLWDLDTEALAKANEHGITMVRAKTAGTDPTFVAGIIDLITEHTEAAEPKVVGTLAARPSPCAVGCCPYEPRRPPS